MTIPRWREIQSQAYRDVKKLIEFLELDSKNAELVDLSPRFALNLPVRLAQKIEKNSPNDPLFLQFVPLKIKESEAGCLEDPTSDKLFQKGERVLQKYASRALLLTTSACAMHCRFCFRQNFPYSKKSGYKEELELIAKDPTLQEIILSGGDPLSLSNAALFELISGLETIAHVKRVRFHTRFPIGIPERIDEEFLDIIEKCRLQLFFVTHCNHPRELDSEVIDSLKKVQRRGASLLNHSVLLKGVNDDTETLKELFNALSNAGILPYYLNALDPVTGASHFDVPISEGKRMLKELQGSLSGYSLPRFVKEIPFEPSKTHL